MDTCSELVKLSTEPCEGAAFESWLELKDAIAFLEKNSRDNEFVVYAGMHGVFIHGIAAPAALLAPPDVADLMSWNCNASSEWGISCSYRDRDLPWAEIVPPLDGTGSRTLDQGEQLVFARHFSGRIGEKAYCEVLQEVVQVSNLHFLEERNAYCRIDKHGDIEEAIRITRIPAQGEAFGASIVTFEREVLDQYLALTDSVLVRTFDFTRYKSSAFDGWSESGNDSHVVTDDLFYRMRVDPGHAGYIRGCQIVRPGMSRQDVASRLTREEPREHASFVAHDWKNRTVRDVSAAPGATANYFTKSDLPYEVSPAFFRPEVLLKYKADPDKYRLTGRSIECRDTWSLQTYDINDAGQVHTYIVYLRHLPFEEQLHWKSYNEPPKGPISQRAMATDFQGNWDSAYDPLESLKEAFRYLNRRQVRWWRMRAANLMDLVHHPVTNAADEWASELLHLDQLTVEGFDRKSLRLQAERLGRMPELEWRSLKLVEECLVGLGFEDDHARQILASFREVHGLRSKLKGHASGEEATAIKKRVLATHQTYREHFRALSAECDSSIRSITASLEKMTPTSPDQANDTDTP
jgi:hypothetical protein